jgi:hypothetical protein
MTPERLEVLMAPGPQYSPTTLRKHPWSISMYEGFTHTFGFEPWPMDGQVAAGFVRFLGLEAKYAIGTISDVVMPGLKRVNMERCGERVTTETSRMISMALRDVRNSRSAQRPVECNEPVIAADLARIISAMPEGHPGRAAEASLFLLCISTGARAITASNVCLGDITGVQCREEAPNGTLMVQMILRVTKGKPTWNHPVTLEGTIDIPSPLNVVYWLEQYLLERWGLSLATYESWRLSLEQRLERLWTWSEDSMRENFKTRAQWAGFPRALFTFHSLRAGFLCSAILKAGTDPNAVRAVLENTALVADWAPFQKAQMQY